MKEKDFNLIYENLYNKYLEQYIKEIENLYKKANEDSDAEKFAYNSCLKTLEEKRNNLKIVNHPFDKLYLVFSDRGSLVQDGNLNRLYIKFIQPECKKMKIEIGHDLFIDLLNEFAISISSKQVYSWFRNWSTLYKMMFELNDFSEFKIFRNCDFSEGSEIFKKYHKRLYPNSYAVDEPKQENKKVNLVEGVKVDIERKQVKNFNILEVYRADFKLMYKDFIEYYIDSKKTTIEDYENVLFEDWDGENSYITFSCSPQEASLLLFKLMEFFSDLNYTNIGKSNVFRNKSGKIMTSTNYGQRVAPFNPKSGILNLSTKQKTMLKRVESFIELIKKPVFKN